MILLSIYALVSAGLIGLTFDVHCIVERLVWLHLTVLVVLGAMGITFRVRRASFLVRVIYDAVFIIVVPLSFFVVASQWPGGDDGPGMAWAFFVGLLSLVGSLLGIGVVIFHLLKRKALGQPKQLHATQTQ